LIGPHINKSVDTLKVESISLAAYNKQPGGDNVYTQVDDFPRLVD